MFMLEANKTLLAKIQSENSQIALPVTLMAKIRLNWYEHDKYIF